MDRPDVAAVAVAPGGDTAAISRSPAAMSGASAGGSAAIPRSGRTAPQHRAPRQGGPRLQASGGRRLRDPIGSWRRIRSGVELLVMTVVLGVLLAAVLAVAIGAIVVALQHALNG